jgi:hypothetical protein
MSSNTLVLNGPPPLVASLPNFDRSLEIGSDKHTESPRQTPIVVNRNSIAELVNRLSTQGKRNSAFHELASLTTPKASQLILELGVTHKDPVVSFLCSKALDERGPDSFDKDFPKNLAKVLIQKGADIGGKIWCIDKLSTYLSSESPEVFCRILRPGAASHLVQSKLICSLLGKPLSSQFLREIIKCYKSFEASSEHAVRVNKKVAGLIATQNLRQVSRFVTSTQDSPLHWKSLEKEITPKTTIEFSRDLLRQALKEVHNPAHTEINPQAVKMLRFALLKAIDNVTAPANMTSKELSSFLPLAAKTFLVIDAESRILACRLLRSIKTLDLDTTNALFYSLKDPATRNEALATFEKLASNCLVKGFLLCERSRYFTGSVLLSYLKQPIKESDWHFGRRDNLVRPHVLYSEYKKCLNQIKRMTKTAK